MANGNGFPANWIPRKLPFIFFSWLGTKRAALTCGITGETTKLWVPSHCSKENPHYWPDIPSMPSRHILAAFETYAKTYQRWNKIPLEWDLKNKKLRTHSINKLLIWKFNICCLLLIVSIIFALVLRQLICKDGRVPLTTLFVNGTSFIVMVAAFFVHINMVCNGPLFVKGYNQLMSLESEMEALEGRLKLLIGNWFAIFLICLQEIR